ncbi:Retrovirus-related Pol polyprotein from transposon opus [Sesamum angolense]|uniref:Retrovirus-related Pol polyprotein from transposon opus n=1 Tax=Sesamum angolense TaxID=2727404 RepID=A0AAE2BTY2_9LAMI|nr:Retrovirus-related Pol polyprotein from transposon opus [Sesamum angolense]
MLCGSLRKGQKRNTEEACKEVPPSKREKDMGGMDKAKGTEEASPKEESGECASISGTSTKHVPRIFILCLGLINWLIPPQVRITEHDRWLTRIPPDNAGPEDRKRVSFITSTGTFCYVAMSFGLKNAGATYQHLVDKIFHPKIERNIEVYVDAMLVKSKESKNYITDLEETFSILRKYRLKLNLGKCAFGVQGGHFLRFMVTQRGNKAKPLKIKAILDMKAPTDLNEVQRLTGRIVALSRFISKVAEKNLPFFNVLRKAKTSSGIPPNDKLLKNSRNI